MTLGQAHLVAFIPSTDLQRSREFYEGALGLTVADLNSFALVLRSGDTTLRVTKVQQLTPHPFTVLGWEVPDIHAAIEALTGVVFQTYDGVEQDDHGVWTAPGGAKVAWFCDPDGNTLSISQH
jgi:catechol 2,3-dioxygenase-like lactoylglutathione lyase family enzyme